jgi:hypothetical protein
VTSLERWYGRLLLSFPKSFREQRGEELLVVLLACAREGQRYPTFGEAVNLVAHGLRSRVRGRRAARRSAGLPPSWALAFPLPTTTPLPESRGQALRTIAPIGFRVSVEDWTYRGVPRWLRAAVALLVLAAVTGIAVTAYDHFFAYSPLTTQYPHTAMQTTSVRVGRTVWVGMDVAVKRTSDTAGIRFDSVSPVIVHNSAVAMIAVQRCGRGSYLDEAYATRDAVQLCRSLTAFAPSSVPSPDLYGGSLSLHLVLAVTPREAGSVEIDGVTIHVHNGWRHGTQHLGTHWTITSHA